MLLVDQDKIYETELPRSIPFNDLGVNLQVWDDGPPPKGWLIASRPGEMGIFTRDFTTAEFDGWVTLSSLCRVTIFGRMKGIRFSFADPGVKDRFFGYVHDESNGVFVQDIDYQGGERVTGIVVLRESTWCVAPEEKLAPGESMESTSITGDEPHFLDRIHVGHYS
jgi:hypothetical protein